MFRLQLRLSLVVLIGSCLPYGCSKADSEAQSKPTLPTKYVVQPGDNLTNIATKFYGDERQRRLLFEANSDVLKHPDQISVGQILKIPALPEKSEETKSEEEKPTSQIEPTPPYTHVVRPGETLCDIATHYYGSPNFAYVIVDANQLDVADGNVKPNTRLHIPDLTAYMPLHIH